MCLVVLGSEFLLPKPLDTRRQCQNFFERTNFKELFESVEPVPKLGALYAPSTMVIENASLQPLNTSFEIPALYAAAPWGPNSAEDWQRFRSEMRAKIQNILRICSKHLHDVIIVSMAASSFASQPVAQVASLWRECLHLSGDTPGLAKRVVFCLSSHGPLKVQLAFKQEFEQPPDLLNDLPRNARKMIVLANSRKCVDARLNDEGERRQTNGIAVGLWQALGTASQENQLWLHLPCGRLVLAAFPSVCLSAQFRDTGQVHLWERVEKNKELQIWSVADDGTIFLTGHPHMFLTANSDELGIASLSQEKSNQVWEMLSADQCLQRQQ